MFIEISLYPLVVPSEELMISYFQPISLKNIVYILKISSTKIHASSPPVPARNSIMAFLSSSGSFGINNILIRSSNSGRFCSKSLISIFAISRISWSSSISNSSFELLMLSKMFLYSL